MAKDRKKLIHIHSNVEDRQPIAGALEYGELGINYSAGKEFISTKNSSDKVVRFSSDEQIVTIMEKKDVIPYSGTVDNINLTTNRSNIEIKLNQVVAGNTVKHDVVNGAKDIDGNPVNPTTDGGITNGAGFAIDTSAFALTGGNPSFSSVSTNKLSASCNTTLKGTTTISGGTSSCGSALNVKVSSATTSAATTTFSGANLTMNNTNVTISGGTLSIRETGNTTIHSDSRLGITSKEDMLESSEGSIFITANSAACVTAGEVAAIGGVEQTLIGSDCGGDNVTAKLDLAGNNININPSVKLTVNGDTYINGDIYTSFPCNSITSTTINDAICEIAASTGQTITAYKLTSASGDVKSASAMTNYTYDPISGSSLTSYTPTDASHINRNTLTFAYAKPVTSTTKYDPGSGTVNTTTAARTTTVNIPNSISHLNEWDTNCLTIDNNLCVTGQITTTGGVFSTSDERKKHDINFIDDESKEKVKSVSLKSFKFNDDNTDRKVYGVIAQDVEAVGLHELVHTDEQGNKAVDYTSVLTLRIAYLEKVINHLHYKLAMMEQKLNNE